ncbi:prohibitin family protein [Candidatus Kapabacteria bacterium]|nr:prohibitin family protein [Candidatus Kapabacteria bacterium]
MFGLIFLGVIGIILGFVSSNKENPLNKFRALFIVVGVCVISIGIFTSAVRQIDAGTVGVQKLFGEVQKEVLYEGLNLINPLIDVVKVDTRQQNYTMSSTPGEGNVRGEDGISVLTSDGLQVVIDLSVIFRINPVNAPEVIKTIGPKYESVIVRPTIRSKIRDIAANFLAIQLYSEKKEEFESELRVIIQEVFDKNGFILEQLLVRKIGLPESVKQSIEDKLKADQEAQKMQFVLQKERLEADRKRVEAQGIADRQKILDMGLSNKILMYEQIQVQKELVKSPNSKIIVLGADGKNSTPLIINGSR